MSALQSQVDGNHYKDLKIQPVEYIHANGMGFIEGNVVKYITRWRGKGGVRDLEKIKHFVDLLIELESKPDMGRLCTKLKTCEQRGWPYAPDPNDPLESEVAAMRGLK